MNDSSISLKTVAIVVLFVDQEFKSAATSSKLKNVTKSIDLIAGQIMSESVKRRDIFHGNWIWMAQQLGV